MMDVETAARPSASYEELRHERGFTLVRSDLAAALLRSARGAADPFEYPFRTTGEIGGGRRPLVRVELEGVGVAAIHKVLRRGGWLGGLLGERAMPGRARREAQVAAVLARARVPCVGLLAIRATLDALVPWCARIEILTEPVERAVDLRDFLAGGAGNPARRRIVARTGEVVAAMHDAGVFHVDLNLRNLLVEPGGEVLLLDFGASRIGEVSAGDRAANLARLWRSCVKLGLAGGAVSRCDAARFVRAYSPGNWRDTFRRARDRFDRSIAFHRLFW